MPNYKAEIVDGKERHFTVGAIIKKDDKILMIERKKKPFGFAGIAGHIDVDETPEKALFREVKEETNFEIKSFELICHEFVPDNECSSGMVGHEWYLYDCDVEGNEQIEKKEAKSMSLYSKDEI